MGRGTSLLAVGFVDAKGTSRAPLLAAGPSGGGFLPQEVDRIFSVGEFLNRRVDLDILGCVRPFPHVFRKKKFSWEIFLDFVGILCGFWQDFFGISAEVNGFQT